MMPPYGAPYAAIYPHGGVYAHPGVPLVSLHSSIFFFLLESNVLDNYYEFPLP
jgi:hypothetical protein